MKLNINWRKAGTIALPVALVGALIGGLSLTSADAATTATPPAPNSISGYMVKDGTLYGADINPAVVKWFTGTWDNTVTTNSVQDGALQEKDFSDAVKTKLNQIGTGEQGPQGVKGDKGDKGDPGTSAIVSVSAATSLTNRPDSGSAGAGTWALDTLSRNFTITMHGAVDADKCGPAATECYLYYASGTDTGTFATVDGWKTPGAGTAGAGKVTGTVSGAIKGQFYATSATPDPSLVDATVNDAEHPTARWAAMFFPAKGVTVTDTDLRDWGWTYEDAGNCNKWTNAKAGNLGDITGVNAC